MLITCNTYQVRQALLFSDAMSAIGFNMQVSFGDFSLTLILPSLDESGFAAEVFEYRLHWAVCQAFFIGLCDSAGTEDYSICGNVMRLEFNT